jgi:hypothetical protein
LVLKSKNGVFRTPFPASDCLKVKASHGKRGFSFNEFLIRKTEIPTQKSKAVSEIYHLVFLVGGTFVKDVKSRKSRKKPNRVQGQKLNKSWPACA